MAAQFTPSENNLRTAFKLFNRFMLSMWRLGLGTFFNIWPAVSGRVMVICHTGRRSHLPRRTPVNYAVVDGDLYCVSGFGQASDWYQNIKSDPRVEVWLPDGWWSGIAEEVGDEPGRDEPGRLSPRRLFLMREVLIGSGFAAYAAGINPRRLSDEELDQVTAEYRLIRIRPVAARTGPGGPGDLAWVWPLATMVLLPMVFVGRRRRRRCG